MESYQYIDWQYKIGLPRAHSMIITTRQALRDVLDAGCTQHDKCTMPSTQYKIGSNAKLGQTNFEIT